MGHHFISHGVFVQNNSYHFETVTENRCFARDGDIVGDYGGDEASIVCGLGGRYAMIGIVDHMGYGLDERHDKSSVKLK